MVIHFQPSMLNFRARSLIQEMRADSAVVQRGTARGRTTIGKSRLLLWTQDKEWLWPLLQLTVHSFVFTHFAIKDMLPREWAWPQVDFTSRSKAWGSVARERQRKPVSAPP